MRPRASLWRLVLGCATTFALIFAGMPSAQATQSQTRASAGEPLAAVGHAFSQVSAVAAVSAGSRTSRLAGSGWQAKKKKHKAKIADPDDLPQPLIGIIPGSTINLLSRSSKLPIAIKNDYDSEVRVRVRVLASNLKVLIPALVEVIVPAHTTVTAKVPVNAIADGQVVLHATLESFSGVRLTVPVDIKMNVILGVEDTALYGFLSFIALLGALGAFRTVRKRRREGSNQ